MAVLVTGGAGYIGSHCVKYLLDANYEVVVVDSLAKGHKEALDLNTVGFYEGDIADIALLDRVFTENKIDCVMHFAAFSLVGESMVKPAEYYRNNVGATMSLLDGMVRHGVKKIVFSSTAATYGMPKSIPITEQDEQSPINTYGETKLAIEKMMKWYGVAYGLSYVSLRYFNVAGAHASGNIGEDHSPETHLIPIILSVANGQRDTLQIYGNDYNTPDGTCVRDYIHIEDLIAAHIKAYEYMEQSGESTAFNLGCGGGFSNLQVLDAARRVTGHPIPSQFAPRREGDPDVLIASSDKAERVLGWKRVHNDIEDIIASAWKWHKNNPQGYKK
ncbi:MAG: UDP-glucose 4-epimerase GalE [Eubacteriales bacterium]